MPASGNGNIVGGASLAWRLGRLGWTACLLLAAVAATAGDVMRIEAGTETMLVPFSPRTPGASTAIYSETSAVSLGKFGFPEFVIPPRHYYMHRRREVPGTTEDAECDMQGHTTFTSAGDDRLSVSAILTQIQFMGYTSLVTESSPTMATSTWSGGNTSSVFRLVAKLSGAEYTTAMLLARGDGTDFPFSPGMSSATREFKYAERYLGPYENPLNITKLKYKVKVLPGFVGPLHWKEVFVPDDTALPPEVIEMSETITAGQSETSIHLIDPLGLDPGDANASRRHHDRNGKYYAVQSGLAVDGNRDGLIQTGEASSDLTSAEKPFRFWINDDDDLHAPGPLQRADFTTSTVDGTEDLKDFFPVFLDVKQLLTVLPPERGYTYKLKQADGAVNFVYTNLTRANAFAYQGAPYSYAGADTRQITASGIALDTTFLNTLKDGTQGEGVILVEGHISSNAPLVLTVEKDGAQIAEVSLPLSIGPRILLLLHGMNSNTATWDTFVANVFGTSLGCSVDIRDGDFDPVSAPPPVLNTGGVRCYRLQFGSLENATTAREGLENLRASNAQGGINGVNRDYLTEPTLRCGDFETFDELAKEVDDAIKVLIARHPNAQIVLVAHSRGGLAGRKFLEGSSPRKSAVVGFLITSSLQQGSPMGRIYQWLDDHKRGAAGSLSDDWQAVDFLRSPTALIWASKTTLDVRRPVINDMSDRSAAIGTLNDPAQVGNLPAHTVYGEIINSKVKLGVLSLGVAGYSAFDDTGSDPFDQLSSAAEAYILGPGKIPADFPGDGLIPAGNQVFTQLPGFPLPGFPPAPVPATGQNTIPRLLVHDRDLVHTDAPNQYQDICSELRLMVPGWFP